MTWLNSNVVNCGPKTSKNCSAWTTACILQPTFVLRKASHSTFVKPFSERTCGCRSIVALNIAWSILKHLQPMLTVATVVWSEFSVSSVIFSAFCMLGLRSACGARNLQCLPCHCASSPAKWGAHHRYGLCGTTAGASGAWKRGWSSKTLKGRSHEKHRIRLRSSEEM